MPVPLSRRDIPSFVGLSGGWYCKLRVDGTLLYVSILQSKIWRHSKEKLFQSNVCRLLSAGDKQMSFAKLPKVSSTPGVVETIINVPPPKALLRSRWQLSNSAYDASVTNPANRLK